MMNYLVYLHSIWLSQRNLCKIFEKQNDYQTFYESLSFDTLSKYIDNREQVEKILQAQKKLDTKKIDEKIEKLSLQIIPKYHKHYPKLLKNISAPPYFLYVRGKLQAEDNFFSIVGSRKMSPYAKKAWESIIPDLTEYFTIVSGWAGWCDSLAHQICVEKNAKTIVVFGTWIDVIYPSGNKALFEKVIENSGALLSIFPLGTLWNIYTFPMRNEIVAGMSSWVLVLEAWEKSWTLITAKLALDQGKNIFCVPGDIFVENYIGAHTLIQNSEAKLIKNTQDILEDYGYQIGTQSKQIHFENQIQQDIYTLLKYNISLGIDDLIEKSQYEYWPLSYHLSLMELQNLIKKDLFWKYQILY